MDEIEIADIRDQKFTGDVNMLDAARDAWLDGAKAILNTFYYGLNARDLTVLDAIWAPTEHIQLNNPLGGITRGIQNVHDLYARVVGGSANVQVLFTDALVFYNAAFALFAGREQGTYTVDGRSHELAIRTTRAFCYYPELGWRQLHHHGSIDDADMLAAYKAAVQSA